MIRRSTNAIGDKSGDEIPLYSPVGRVILQVEQESETTLPTDAPILEIGDVTSGLELAAELILSDVVQLADLLAAQRSSGWSQ